MDKAETSHRNTSVTFCTPKRVVLLQTLVFSIVIAILSAGFIRNSFITGILSIINVLGWGVCILAWIKADSRLRGYALHRHFPLIVVIFGTVALIYYLFRSRGFVQGLVGLAYFVLFALLTLTVSIISAMIVMIITVMIAGPRILEPV